MGATEITGRSIYLRVTHAQDRAYVSSHAQGVDSSSRITSTAEMEG
jgi:hypothetical protein